MIFNSDNNNSIPNARNGFFTAERVVYYAFVLLTVLVSLLLLEHILRSDDTIYFANTNLFPPTLEDWKLWYGLHDRFRVGLYIFGKAIQLLFGYNITAYYIAAIIMHVVLFSAVFWLAKRFNGLSAAVYASLFFLTSFFSHFRATNFMTDRPSAACCLLAFLTFIVACESKMKLRLLFLSAFLAFYAYLCRLPLIVFPACFVLYEFLKYRTIKRSVIFFLFLGGLIAAEGLFYYFVMDDFMARLYSVKLSLKKYSQFVQTPTWLGFLFIIPIKFLSTITGKVLFAFSLGGIALAYKRKKYEVLALVAGGLIVYCLMAYSAESYFPLRTSANVDKFRQYILLFSIGGITSGYFLSWLIPAISDRFSWGKFVTVPMAIIVFSAQAYEIPGKMNMRILGGKDDYFVMNRLVGEGVGSGKLNVEELKGNLYCPGLKEFLLFPSISGLKLQDMNMFDLPKAPFYAIMDVHRVEASKRYAPAAKQDLYMENLGKLTHPDGVILSYKDLILVKYEESELREEKFFSLDEGEAEAYLPVTERMRQRQWYKKVANAAGGVDIRVTAMPPKKFFYSNLFALQSLTKEFFGGKMVKLDLDMEVLPDMPIGSRHFSVWILCYSGKDRVVRKKINVRVPVDGEKRKTSFTFYLPPSADRMEGYLRFGDMREIGGIRITKLDLFEVRKELSKPQTVSSDRRATVQEKTLYSLRSGSESGLVAADPTMKQSKLFAKEVDGEGVIDISYNPLPREKAFYSSLFALVDSEGKQFNKKRVKVDMIVSTLPGKSVGANNLSVWMLCFNRGKEVARNRVSFTPLADGEEQKITFIFKVPATADSIEGYLRIGEVNERGGIRVSKLELTEL